MPKPGNENGKKNCPQVYLECKCKIKKIKTPKFINTDLESESEPDTELEPKSELRILLLIIIFFLLIAKLHFR